MMLQRRNNNFIVGPKELASIAVHHQIDAFGRAAHKDTLLRLARVDETPHLLARTFVSGRRLLAQIVNAAMNVGMLVFEIDAAAIDYHLRDLRRGGVVEID